MDPIIAKLIQSREKSIVVLEAEVARMEVISKGSVNPDVIASLTSVLHVKRQRIVKLQRELVGFRASAAAQLEVPGTEVPSKRR